MTTGTRIAQKRKELGLSQEQLGEQLGVSRQSIYKWESDAVLPEVEKLVALSKLFSVTVGWLLGVEDESTDVWDGELSEAQLRVVEEIAARYRPAPDKKKRRQFMTAAGVVAVIIAAVFIALSVRMSTLQKSYHALQGQFGSMQEQFGSMQNNVQTQIAGITNQVASALEQQAKITSNCDATIQNADLAANTVTFTVSATPKTYVEGMQAVFIAESEGKSTEAPAVLGEGQHFSGTVTCPLSDEITISVAFITDGTRQTQVIDFFPGLYAASFRYSFGSYHSLEQGQLSEGIYDNHKVENYDPQEHLSLPRADFTKVRMGLFRDKKLVKWLTTLDGLPESEDTRAYYDIEHCVFFRNDKTVVFDEGHSYTLVIVAADKYGREQIFPGPTYSKIDGSWCDDGSAYLPLAHDNSGNWIF